MLRLQPRLQGAFAVIHPLFRARGWAGDDRIELGSERVFGGAELWVSQLEYDRQRGPVRMQNRQLPVVAEWGAYCRVDMMAPVRLAPQVTLAWEVG